MATEINEQGFRRRIGSDYLIGNFTKDVNGNTFFTDIRGEEGNIVENPFDSTEELKISYNGIPLEDGVFYSFLYHLDNDSKSIVIDGNVSKVDNSKFVQGIFDARLKKLNGSNLEQFNNIQKTIFNEVTGAQHTYIYELLQNANDYPFNREHVSVKFILTDYYLFFMHSGACFNLRNVVGISSINQGEKRSNTETIGYKGIGFKTVFVNNEYVYINSGDWSFRFDRNYAERAFCGECPWALMPIPTFVSELAPEVQYILAQHKMRVQFALRHKTDARQNLAQLNKVFSDNQILLFIPNVYRVDVIVDGESKYVVEKDDNKWVVADYTYSVPETLKQWVNENINSGEKIPEKFKDIHHVRISFAVGRESNRIIPIENAKVYNYLPTELCLGFGFLFNADFVPNGSRSGLHDVEWNNRIMEQCGSQFADWWAGLMKNEGEYDLQSVFDILPEFDSRDNYARLFIQGFRKRIVEISCIPIFKDGEYRLVKLSETLYDKIGLVTSDNPVFTDDEFYRFTVLDGYLPHKDIRCHDRLIKLFNFSGKSHEFNYSGLDKLTLFPSFQQWLKIKENNINFLDFLLSSGYIQNLWGRNIFLKMDGTLERAEKMYYDVDKFIEDISFLNDDLPRFDTEVRDALHQKLLKDINRFKKFDDFRFIQSVFDKFDSNKIYFENKDNSIRFIHFLAVTNSIREIPTDYPLYLDDDSMVYGKDNVYIKNDIGVELASHSWIDKAWIGFLNEDYLTRDKENVSSYLTSKCRIRELTTNECYRLFIANDKYVPEISVKIKDRSANIDFYHYLLTISDEIGNFTPAMRQNYTILTTDGKNDLLVPVTCTVFWNDVEWEQMAKLEWMPGNSCLAVQNIYFVGLGDEDSDRLRSLLSTKQIVQKFSIPGLYQTIRTRLNDIFALITTKELSKDILDFLFINKKDIFKSGIVDTQFRKIPILCKGQEELVAIDSVKRTIYLPNQDLIELYNMPWFDKASISLCDDFYDDLFDGRERCGFFEQFGLKKFNKLHYIPAHLLLHLNEIREALSIRENNILFHRYIADCHDRFGETDLAKVKDVPIFIESPNDENGEWVDNSTKHYLPSTLLSDIVSRDILPVSILDSIHPDYIKSEKDKKYFIDKLGNVEMNEEEFFSYIVSENNIPIIEKYLRDEERNIRFWRWVCDSNANRETKSKLRVYPMLARTLGSEANVFAKSEDLFVSSVYSDATGIERFISQFVDEPKFVSPDYKEPDKASNWITLLKALKVTVDYKEIVFKELLPNLKKYKDTSIVPILAQYLDDFKDILGKGDKNVKEQLGYLRLLCDDGQYYAPTKIVFSGSYFDVTEDPFPEIVLNNLVSDDYLTNCGDNQEKRRNVVKFITFIADTFNDGECRIKYESKTQLRDYKVRYFMKHQEFYIDSDVHFKIVARLAELLAKDCMGMLSVLGESNKLKMKTISGLTITTGPIYLSSSYYPACDFMGNGITGLDYISEKYIQYCDYKKLKYLFQQFGVNQHFTENHITLLQHECFAMYFWEKYAVDNSDWVRQFCNSDYLYDKLCIPTTSGVRKPCDLYDYRKEDLLKIVRKLSDWESKIPSIVLPEWLNRENIGLRNNLYLLDCLEYLKLDTNDFRRKVLEWVIKTPDETLNRNQKAIDDYIAQANWFSGAKQWVPLSSLVALEWENITLKDNFGNNSFVCNPSYMPEYKVDFDRLCKIFKIKILTNSDFKKYKEGNCNYDAVAVKEIAKRLLYLAYKTGKTDWKVKYDEYLTKLNASDISTCERIVYAYNEHIQNDLCIYAEEADKLWYQGEWNGFMFQGIVEWIVNKIGIVGFDKNYLYRLFHTPFNQFLRKEEGGILPLEFINLLEDTDCLGISVDENAYAEEYNEDSENKVGILEGVSQRPVSERQQHQYKAQYPTSENRNYSGQSGISNYQYQDRKNQSEANSIDRYSGSIVNKEKGNEERNNSVSCNSVEHRIASNREQVPKITDVDQIIDETVNELSIDERLEEKWARQKRHRVERPMFSSGLGAFAGVQDNSHPNNESTGESFFDDKSVSNGNYHVANNRIEQNLKRKNTEAQEFAKKAADSQGIYERLIQTPKYTFKWFKYQMELQFAGQERTGRRTVKIDFNTFERQERNDLIRLILPSINFPTWLENADIAEIVLLAEDSIKSKATIVSVNEFGIDVIVEAYVLAKIDGTCRVKLLAESTMNIIDSLCDRFIQLDYADDFDLNENLPSEIEFIYGPPGTGKTTRLVERLRQIVNGGDGKNILVLTPTNKAADVIATKLVDDEICGLYTRRFGSTESQYLMSCTDVLYTRDTMDMEMCANNIVVSTAARYSYDCIQPDDVAICDFNWDYIIVDEASMVDLVTITFVLHKGKGAKFIIAGDPKQIQPVNQGDVEIENIYQMVGLDSFKDAIEHYDRYPIEALTTQYRSISTIGDLVSQFAYNGMVKNDVNRSPQKPLTIDGLSIRDINFIGFKTEDFNQMYGLTAINGSAFHLYSAIFTYNLAAYLVSQITSRYSEDKYTIGIVCPYKAEADAIQQLIENRKLDTDVCAVYSGTVHKFQGDECDIMFVIMNPPVPITSGCHINRENIINVAMSRARDYIFFILPEQRDEKFITKNRIGRLVNDKDRSIMHCSEIEQLIFGNPNYLYENTNISCHLPVNVYYDTYSKYEVRIDDTTLDIQIND